MNADGSGAQRIAGPMLAFHSVSPDGMWAVAYTAVKDADVSVACSRTRRAAARQGASARPPL
jgi:hypothetical protein